MADLHAYAVQAEKNLEQLATGLAQAGADEQTVKAVSQMAEVTRKIVTALGKGQAATGDQQPPEQQAPEQQTQHQEQQPEQRQTIGGATHELHNQMQQKPGY